MPFLMILGGVGFMFGTGGGALIAKTMGEGKAEKADKLFSMTVFASILCGLVLTAVGLLFLRPFARLMGAEGELLENSLLYGTINLIALPFYILQYEFQCLFATAEKPKLGLYVTVASGVANMVLDWLLVAVLPFGLAGAAAATAASQFIGGVFPLVYFARKNSSRLRLTRCRLELRPLGRICANGSSELMSNISMSLVSMLYNVQLMQYAGEDGIARLWRTDVCQHDLSGHLHRLFRGYRAYRQLPLRCAEPGRTQEPAAESHLYCGDCRAVHVRRRGTSRRSPFPACSWPMTKNCCRPPMPLRHFLLLIPVLRLCHQRLVLLYRAERRPDLRPDLRPAYTGVSGGGRTALSPAVGVGRHLVLHRGGGDHGRAGFTIFFPC